MKKVLLALFASATAFGATHNLNCVVPIEGKAPVITAAIEVYEESQGDFLSVTFTEPNASVAYYNQLEKGAYQKAMNEGQLVTLVISEGAQMENGAIRGAGFLVLGKEGSTVQGFASLNNTFYPLVCQ